MAEFAASIPQVDLTPSVQFDPLAGLRAQGMQQEVLGKTLANQYTAAVQPSQINLLMQGLGEMSGGSSPQNSLASVGSAAPAQSPTATPAIPADPNGPINPALAQAESSGNPAAINKQGYAGLYGFGTDRLKDLGMYQPADGENPKANAWQGQLNIPGHPEVKTLADFKASIPAQNAAYQAHASNINGAIQATPGAENYNPNGLLAVAHLGGVGGMQKFVASGGRYNPNDGQTSLADYYKQFSTPQTGGVQPTSGPVPPQPTGGMDVAPTDPAATAAVRQLVGMSRYYAAMPDGKGARAAAQIQQQLDNIAGPGGIVDPRTGLVMRVPGTFATRYAAAQAAEAGKAGPSAALYQTNEGVRTGGEAALAAQKAALERQTHAANVGVDVQGDALKPVKVSPGETLTTPAAVGVGTAPPAGAPMQMANGATAANDATPPGTYQAPANPDVAAASKEGDQSVAMQQPILDQAKEGQNALNRIGQVRAAIKQATDAGLPPGYYSPELATAVAAAKSLGFDPSTVGINAGGVQSAQVAREALTQINGEILKRMFPQRITNADVATFGANLANYGMDPAALDAILNQAEQAAHYDVDKGHDMLAYKAAKGNTVGWDAQFYKKSGFGPDLFNAVKSGTVPAPAAPAPGVNPAAAAPSYSMQSPARPGSRADVMALPSGTPFINPANGQVLTKH